MNYLHDSEIKKKKILIVDDDPDFTEATEEFLLTEGFTVHTCYRGRTCLEYVTKESVDLILLDLLLPDIDGKDVARQLREIVFIPTIIISGKNSESDKVDGLQFADDYVTKPFSHNELVARIQALLRICQLQTELKQSKERYQCLYENIPEMCISLDKNRFISDCNTMLCSCFNASKKELQGKQFKDLFHEKDHSSLEVFLDNLTPQHIKENKHIYQLSHTDRDGNPLFISLKAISLENSEKGVWVIIAMKDVSIQLKLEKQQKLARKQLYRSARLASIGSLASGTAHEMNNPLTAILGFSDSLFQRYEANETIERTELLEYLSIIRSEAIRCRDVVENLSKFSQDTESNTEKVDLYDCVQAAVSLLHVSSSKKNISIHNNTTQQVYVTTDILKLNQVLVNIISNAIDFCANGSSVIIKEETIQPKDSMVRLCIQDNGPGISDKVMKRLFDPFVTTKEVGKGLGLGISISYKLMEDCGGRIHITSKRGFGTTVTLEIPYES